MVDAICEPHAALRRPQQIRGVTVIGQKTRLTLIDFHLLRAGLYDANLGNTVIPVILKDGEVVHLDSVSQILLISLRYFNHAVWNLSQSTYLLILVSSVEVVFGK